MKEKNIEAIETKDKEFQKKIDRAILLLQSAEKAANAHGQPLEICYSGGKDSDVILELARMANINYRAIYRNTTIDPPGTIKHVKEQSVEVLNPKMTFREIIVKKGLPSRTRRHCCEILKEYKMLDYAVIGVRRDESATRAKYEEPTTCREYKKGEYVETYMPILEWKAKDVEEFIKERKIKCHPLYYDENGTFHVERRLGCIGCPLAYKKHRIQEFKQYPKMARLYINAAQKFLDSHPNSTTKDNFKNACEWFTFTLYCDTLKEWSDKFGRTLFDAGIDCNEHLSKLFNITI